MDALDRILAKKPTPTGRVRQWRRKNGKAKILAAKVIHDLRSKLSTR